MINFITSLFSAGFFFLWGKSCVPGVLDCPFTVAASLLLQESRRYHQLSTSFYKPLLSPVFLSYSENSELISVDTGMVSSFCG